ncbi:MAG: hydroxyacid dehydrogenase [Lachnospiraceae bacterium]|nr:hydroxyacid dehydrogenase [Lachnospiraceae bacterium]
MKENALPISVLDTFPSYDHRRVDELLRQEVSKSHRKIVVLDDDPTGVQTVHDVSVYTDWSEESIRKGFEENRRLFYILTNSRGLTREQTVKVHREIAANLTVVSKKTHQDFLLISRSDSTLRGHYPLETEILRGEMEKRTGETFDGEILCPFFLAGGRYTIGNVHYVKMGDVLIPAAQTEFAQDQTFGYHSSSLPEYVEEKTGGRYRKESCVCIGLEELESLDVGGIEKKLTETSGFQKIIVNAVCEDDLKVFAAALYRALEKGKHFLYRTAASFVKAVGDVEDRPLLTHRELASGDGRGGIIVVGSHTAKTTAQLEELRSVPGIDFLELNSDLVLDGDALEEETKRVIKAEGKSLQAGRTVCVFTRRKLLTIDGDTEEEALVRSVKISDAVRKCVGELQVTPSFIVAKGGITSSDIGVKALQVRRADVLGQIEPGIPVWRTGKESRFPGVPYAIFPGNVGEKDTLRKAVQKLMYEEEIK